MKINTVIIGAGISGLSTANFLSKKTLDFIIVESSNKVGGIIDTHNERGYTCENGPNTVLNNNSGIQELLDDLKISDDLIYPNNNAIKNRYVLKDGKPIKIPLSFSEFFISPLFSMYSKIRILLEVFVKKHKHNTDVKSFISRRFGNEFHERLIVPFLTGIYADETKTMSAKHTLKTIWELEQNYGSVIIGLLKMKKSSKSKIFTFKNGLSHLINSLKNKFHSKIIFNSKISKIQKVSSGYDLFFSDGQRISCKNLISTIPSFSLSELVFDLKFKKILSKINYVPIDVFHFGFDKKNLENKIDGFGLLTKPEDEKNFLGILYSSNIFNHVAKKNKFLLTVLVGGKRQQNLCKEDPKKIEKLILAEVNDILKINTKPEFIKHYRWKRGIPTYNMSMSDIIDEIRKFEDENSNFYIHGNFHNGVSVSDCILNSKKLVEANF